MPTSCFNTSKEEIVLRWQTASGDAQKQNVPVGGMRVITTVPDGGQVLASKITNEMSVYTSIINKEGQPLSFDDAGAQYGAPKFEDQPAAPVVPKKKSAVYSLPLITYQNDPQPWKWPLYLLLAVAGVFVFIYISRK